MIRTDILIDESGDLAFVDGDFCIGKSDPQHVEMLLTATKGSLIQYPEMGAGLANFLKKQSTQSSDMRRQIEVNLRADGYRVLSLGADASGEFKVDYEPNY